MSDELAEAPPERQTGVTDDGFIYDVDSGEILGLAELPPAFQVDSDDAANFVLRVRSEIEGRIAGIDARRRAVLEQFDAQRAAAVRRLSWWEWRFGSSLVGYARTLLTGKSRTAQFDWGRVSFRRTPGNAEIVDTAAALEYVQLWAPDQVKVVRTVNLAAVRAAARAAAEATGEPEDRLPFLAEGGPGESVTVTTGVETRGKA